MSGLKHDFSIEQHPSDLQKVSMQANDDDENEIDPIDECNLNAPVI